MDKKKFIEGNPIITQMMMIISNQMAVPILIVTKIAR